MSRGLLEQFDSTFGTDLQSTIYARPVTHRNPPGVLSLSDRQVPGNQLRFYTRERALRGFRYLGYLMSEHLASDLKVEHTALLTRADVDFVHAISQGGVAVMTDLNGDASREEGPPLARVGPIDIDLALIPIDVDQCSHVMDSALAMGDSWTAVLVAAAVESGGGDVPARLADSIGVAYALQGMNALAEQSFQRWESRGGIEAARAQYSLAMMYARHHDRQLLDAGRSAAYLEQAWEILSELPSDPDVLYERVFNRNGYALLLFRDGKFDEAAQLLEAGILELGRTEFDGALHHTVLLNNLGRVYDAMGRTEEACSALGRATELDELFAEYWQDLASHFCDRAEFARAKDAAVRACGLDPAIPQAHELLGYIEVQLGNPGNSVRHFDLASKLGSLSAPLSALRALSDDGDYVGILSRCEHIQRAQFVESEDAVELELLKIEALSFLSPDYDPAAEMRALHHLYPSSQLLRDNLDGVSQ